MNYFEWSKEYEQTARSLDRIIDSLTKQGAGKGDATKKEINNKIASYKAWRNEALRTANHLMRRHKGVA